MIQQMRKKFPYGFLIFIFGIIVVLYIAFVKLLILDMHLWPTPASAIFLIVYHVFLLMLLWSIVEAFKTDPGRVPKQWGFTIDNRQKKYCLICHVFKPERTHHCSACNRCILNMDHHCPWINTCIGFYNRKAFILMLIYTAIGTFIHFIAFALSVPGILNRLANFDQQIAKNPNQNQAWFIIRIILICLAFVFNCIIFVMIILFLKFHLQLIFKNLTTLETLQLKRQGKNPENAESKYNIGNYYNWAQVFGRNSLAWPIPIFLKNQGPSGDGVIWPKTDSIAL